MALLDNLVSYWPLNEASGDALDAHGSNDLTETGGTIGADTGVISGSRDFEDGDTEMFQHVDNADLSVGDIDFTFTAWFNRESAATFPPILSKNWKSGGTDREFIIYINSNAVRLAVQHTSDSSEVVCSTSVSSLGTWYFVAAWHDSAANEIGISVNAGTPNTAAHTAGVNDGTGDFAIGGSPSFPLYFDGKICEVGFWKRVLTSDERTELYNGGAGLAYPFASGGHPAARRLWTDKFRPVEIGRQGVNII